MKKKKDSLTSLERQQRAFRLQWLLTPLALCGILFNILPIFLQNFGLSQGIAQLISALIAAPLAFFAYLFGVSKKVEGTKGWPTELYFRVSIFIRYFLLAFFVAIAVLACISVFGDVTIRLNNQLADAMASVVGIALATSMTEELLFRGVLFRFAEKYYGSLIAIAISALVFGLQHMFNPNATLWTGVAITIEAGISLALIYIVTRNLWATIGVHFGWNFTVGLLGLDQRGIFQTDLHGPAWLTGGKYGVESSIAVVGLWSIVSAVFLILAIKRRSFVSFKRARKLNFHI